MAKFNMFITLLVLPFYWIRSQFLRRFGSQDKIDKEMKMYSRHYLGFRRKKVIQHGTQPDPDVPCLYVSNHQSHNDIFIALGAINRPFRFVAKKELFESKVTGTFMKMSESYPLDREDARESLLLLRNVVKDVNAGHTAFAFPEGTRSYKSDMLPFKDGLFSMFRKADVPIVVMYIKESYNELQKDFHVYFSDPIQPETFKPLKGQELSELIFEVMNQLKDKAYA